MRRWRRSKSIDFIIDLLPDGKTVLELGSGEGTKFLLKHFTVYSVEHMTELIGKYKSNYIHAPIRKYDDTYLPPDFLGQRKTSDGRLIKHQLGWYDYRVLEKELPTNYDLLLIDGPTAKVGRAGFYKHLDLFNTSVPMVFDDVNNVAEKMLLENVSEKLGLDYKIIKIDTVRRQYKGGSIGVLNVGF